ncbi:hypothetical protein DL764_001147 [Monosporascus ibericus]|uniref:Uncharacterized protein n=1 Tax=Monosporascus ibericus TaxID=155417 RepID=A0A4Q4TQX9_9PEZI|nr:hypothetical protein DL764_001147 [Monosporascus ibericus]
MAPTVLLAASFGIAVQALALDGRQAKRTEANAPTSTRPFPSHITIPPSALDLKKRQEVQTVLVGPDNTCGYISGRAGAVYSCNVQTAQCAFVTNSGFGAVACCNEYDCGLRVTCLDYEQIYSSSSCDYGCLQDTFTAKCTSTLYPYCGTISFFDGIMDYYCDSLSGSVIQQAETTYSGQTDGRTFTPIEVTTTDPVTGPSLPSSGDSGGFTPTGNTDGPNPTDPNPTDPNPTDPSPIDPSPIDPSPTDPAPGATSGSTNIGAIVGGVVGGVVGIALIALLAFFLIRRNNKKKTQQHPPQQPGYPPMQQQQQPGLEHMGPPPGHGSVYNPSYPPPQQQFPPQQGTYPPGYYQDQNKPAGFVNMATVPDRNQSTSPGSQVGDNVSNMQPASPTSTVHSAYPPSHHGAPPQQQQHHYPSGVPPTVHEAHSNVVGQPGSHDNHRGQFHELPDQPMR